MVKSSVFHIYYVRYLCVTPQKGEKRTRSAQPGPLLACEVSAGVIVDPGARCGKGHLRDCLADDGCGVVRHSLHAREFEAGGNGVVPCPSQEG